MRLSICTDVMGDLAFTDMLDKCVALGVEGIEMTGGTEEEFTSPAARLTPLEALRAVRAVSGAMLVCKRGAAGAVAFTDAVPGSLDDGETGPGFPIEVFNVLGAGDGFFSGLLKGWMADAGWPTALAYACGAFAVSRHGCTPAYPSLAELDFFLARGIVRPDLRNDRDLEQIHWSTNRAGRWPTLSNYPGADRQRRTHGRGLPPAKSPGLRRARPRHVPEPGQ